MRRMWWRHARHGRRRRPRARRRTPTARARSSANMARARESSAIARASYARANALRAFYVGRGAPLAIACASVVDDGRVDARKGDARKGARKDAVDAEDVYYACATADGGVALARSRTTRGRKATTSRARELARADGDGEAMTAIAMDAKGSKVFCASRSGRLVRLDVVEIEGETVLRTIKAWNPHRSSPVLDMCVDSTGTLLCTGSADRTARVWDIERGFCTHAFRGRHGGAVTVTAFHPNTRVARAFTASDDGSVAMWSLTGGVSEGKKGKKGPSADGCLKFIADAHVSAVTTIKVDVDTNTLLTAGRDRIIRTYDLDTLTPRTTTAVHETIEDCVILGEKTAIVRDGKVKPPPSGRGVIFAVVGDGGRVRVWREGAAKHSLESGPLIAEKLKKGGGDENDDFEAAAATFTKCALSEGGDRLIGVSGDARLLTYKVNAETCALDIEREIVANTDEVIGLAFVPSANEVSVEEDTNEDEDETRELAIAPRQMAVVTNSPTVRVFDPTTMSCVGSLIGHTAVVLSVDATLTTDGTALIATGAKDHTVRLWDPNTQRCVAVGEGHVGAVSAVAFPPKSSRGVPFVISGGADRVLRVWDVEGALRSGDGELNALAATVAHDKSLNGVAVAPHLRLVATCSSDKTAKIWKMPDLVPLATLRGHRRGVWACAFSPTDRVLATAGGDKTVKIWSVDDRSGSDTSGACLRTLEGHTAAVLTVKFISRGTQLVTTGGDGLLNLWNVTVGSRVSSIDAHEDKAWALAVSSDGDWLSTGGTDASMSLWKDSTTSTTAEAAQKHALDVKQEQAFFNAERAGQLQKAIDLALTLERPASLLRVLTRLFEDDYANGDARLRECVEPLHGEKLKRVLTCIREWNTNGRTCHVAQHVLAAVFRTHSMNELSEVPDITQILRACRAYTERHRSRLERLYRGTFMVDTLLVRSGAIVDDEETQEQIARSYETIDDFGFMRSDSAPAPALAKAPEPSVEDPASDNEPEDVSEEDNDMEENTKDEDEDEDRFEDEEDNKSEDAEENDEDDEEDDKEEVVKDEEVVMGPPKKLARLNVIKRLSSNLEDRRKLMRDPSPRHTRSGRNLG